jgi:hypothetical protein
MINFKKIKSCRICKSKHLITCFDLGKMSLTGVFPHNLRYKVPTAPIELVMCKKKSNTCGLVQLKHSYNSNYMYGLNYGYRSGLNPSMVSHLKERVNIIKKNIKINNGDIILDIGSNDGTTLSFFNENQNILIGIDPTIKKFKKFYKKKIITSANFFSNKLYINLSKNKKAKVIMSFAMFYDLENPINFAEEIKKSLDDDGIWVFEQSYLPSMIRTNSFDTICHEHLSYYSIQQIKYIMDKVGFKIINIEINDVNGGSFCITVKKSMCQNDQNLKYVNKFLKREKKYNLNSYMTWKLFRNRVEEQKKKLNNFIKENQNKKICFLGASTKGNVLLQYYNINNNLIKYIGEINKDKFNCYTPGTNLKIVNQKYLLSKYDYFIVLPWHFKNFFLKYKLFKKLNLVFPLPFFNIKKVE